MTNVLVPPQPPPAGIYDTFLDTTYKALVGQTFLATYQESYSMPQTNNVRDILVVEVQNPFAAILKDIRDKVVATCGEKVWKGITCTFCGNVWLWVEPTFGGIIDARSTHWFKIEETTVFPCNLDTRFPHGGVSIKASLSPPTPQVPSTIPVIQMGTGFPHGGGSIKANPLAPILSPFHQVTQMAACFPHGAVSIKGCPLTQQIPSTIHQVTYPPSDPNGERLPSWRSYYQGKPADATNSVYYPSDPNGHPNVSYWPLT